MLTTSPAPAQHRLAELLADRSTWIGGHPDASPATTAPDTTVLVMLRSLSLPDLVHGARDFAARLEPEEAAAWLRSWTRTRFLFGNPANLTSATVARTVAPGGTAAWLGPYPDERRPGLSRLLKPVTGELPVLPDDVDVPGTGPVRVLTVAVGGLGLVDYLVHLHHTLAEAVLRGRLRPDEPVRLRHRTTLEIEPSWDPPAYARVLPEHGDHGPLRLYTWLSHA